MANKKAAQSARVPKSKRLFEAGFKTVADATQCLEAVVADLAAERISATEANQYTSAAGKWLRTTGSRLQAAAARRRSG